MRSFFVYGILLTTLLTACEERVNIQLRYEGDKIVINSLLQPDSVAYVRITRSVPANVYDEGGFTEIGNAAVTLLQNGVAMSPLQQQQIKGRTYFVSREKVTNGNTYTINVSAAGLTPVSAQDTLPVAPIIADAAGQKGSTRVVFTLKDRPGAADYYRIRLFAYGPDNQPDTARGFRLDPAFNNNLIDVIANTHNDALIMDDTRFDGKTVNFVLETQALINSSRMMLEVSTMTDGGFKYFRTLGMQYLGAGGLLAEPAPVYTNVHNGYGIVAGINSRRLVFDTE
ncbi:DUF4249 domain-containing protein [Chitinophaga qingshengii]|uniref:DUF4249 domain-containing protein n=1 Tax=Chitinophaga qingshengii TaxID=1569794 RepID=A0ABR7TN32_9BACT|nr:DUF4249 domain-containing protein [Chitinophaga qingshengii]MBC9930958.1 DUF4249 domain-containing protein [Chitinophaga qingshengii]